MIYYYHAYLGLQKQTTNDLYSMIQYMYLYGIITMSQMYWYVHTYSTNILMHM